MSPEPEPGGALGISHVEIYVSELDRSIEFWGWLLPELGFEPYQQWDEGRSWRHGETYVVIVQAPEPHGREALHRKRPGVNHLAFRAPSTDAVDALTEKLRERGVPLLYEDRAEGAIGAPSPWAIFFEDPDRLKVEVVAAS